MGLGVQNQMESIKDHKKFREGIDIEAIPKHDLVLVRLLLYGQNTFANEL